MFDLGMPATTGTPPGTSPVRRVLDPAVVLQWSAQLSAALDDESGLDDRGRVEGLRALERLGCVATAAQAKVAVELDTSRREERAARGLPAAQQGRGVAHEVAVARRESPHRAQRHLALAKSMGELPHTWRAWREGRITEWQATLIARETACLSQIDRRGVDATLAGDGARLERMGLRELVGRLQAEAARLDPASVVTRRRRAEADRHVSLRPAPDTMTWLTALLPVQDGVATYAALTRAADTARATGDPRSGGQLMADALVGRVLEGQAAEAGAPPVSLGLVMTDHDLFGHGDQSAHLEGYGPIPSELAREIVTGAVSAGEQLWLRRLYTHPDTGHLVAMDGRGRRFRGSLARFVRLRDQVCRTPWCDAPVRHLDHALDHARHGPTSGHNAQGLCESCNHAKQAPGWHASPSPAGDSQEVETRLPTGHRFRTRPPRLLAAGPLPALRVEELPPAGRLDVVEPQRALLPLAEERHDADRCGRELHPEHRRERCIDRVRDERLDGRDVADHDHRLPGVRRQEAAQAGQHPAPAPR